jgi:hypothetical protein
MFGRVTYCRLKLMVFYLLFDIVETTSSSEKVYIVSSESPP